MHPTLIARHKPDVSHATIWLSGGMPAFPACVPTIRTGEVTLRAHHAGDIPRIVEFATDPRSMRWVPLPSPYAEREAHDFLATVRSNWQDGTSSTWAIEVDGMFAGSINLRHHHRGVAEIGFGAHPAVRGRGVMTRAVRAVIDHGFDRLGLHTIVWRAGAGNFSSRRVAWANGFRVDGTWPAMHGTPNGTVGLWFGHLCAADPREPAHPWFAPAPLDGDGVRLRAWRPGDTPPRIDDPMRRFFLHGATTTPDIAVWCEQQRERMASGEGVFWCIADPESDRPLGHLQIIRLNQPMTAGSGMLGYFLDPSARGCGIIQRSLDRVITHAFASANDGGLGLHRLEAGTDVDNTPSQRSLRRAGFRQCATEHEVLAMPNGPSSGALSFELLARDDREAARVIPLAVPTLRTERLTLRAWRTDDRPRPDQRLDVASALFMPAGAQPTTGTFDAWLRRRHDLRDIRQAVTWCIADAHTDDALGSIGVFGLGEGTPTNAEVGYWVHTDARGRGYSTEALAAVVTHAFSPPAEGGMGLTRLHAGTDLDNLASQHVLEKAGFHRWGTDRQAYARADGTHSDGAHYELLAGDLVDD